MEGENNLEPPKLKRRHVAAATIGNALEFYDFLTYAFFSIQIGHAFFPVQSAYGSLMLSLATFGAGFVTRPIGALVIGAYSDRVGRRPAMMLCFVLIGCSIVVMALIPTYATIGIAAPILAVIARMVQGFSLGGEIGSNTAYLMEAAPDRQARPDRFLAGRQPEYGPHRRRLGRHSTDHRAAGRRARRLWLAHRLPARRRRRAVRSVAAHQSAGNAACAGSQRHRAGGRPIAAGARRGRIGASSCWGCVVLAAGTIGSYIFTYLVTYAQATLHLPARAGFIAEASGQSPRHSGHASGRLAVGSPWALAGQCVGQPAVPGADLSDLPAGSSRRARKWR